MAYRRSRGKAGKIQPAVQQLTFLHTTDGNTQDELYIDLSQCASLVNRRFYRQGIQWAVSGIKIHTTGSNDCAFAILKLPSTWIMSNAWEKGFRAWQKMNNEALEEAPSIKPKFLDFKIYADVGHHVAGYGANLIPVDGDGNTYTLGEWESSKYVIPASPAGSTNSREVIAVGPNFPGVGASGLDAVSLIEGYAASRALPDILDPNTPTDATSVSGSTPENWQAALFDEGTTQDDRVLDDMTTENNLAPYPFENDGTHIDTMYPGGANQAPSLELHDFDLVTPTTVGGATRINGGMFPCGLMKIRLNNLSASAAQYTIKIDLVPGKHRGYLCEPMTEM